MKRIIWRHLVQLLEKAGYRKIKPFSFEIVLFIKEEKVV